MISRLLLVGMVGVLGISLPDGAEWGTGLTWARTDATACVARRDTIAFEPIVVDDDPIDRFVDELNRRSEGLDIPAAPSPCVETPPRKTFAPVLSSDSIELKLMVEFGRIGAEPEGRAIPAPRSLTPPVATEPDRAIDELFADNQVWSDPTAEEITSSIPPARQPRPSFEPIAVVETTTEFADELNHASEGIDIAPAPTVRRPQFEPIAVLEDSSSLADDLNRASEGQSVAPDSDRGIGDAIRLTRSAALAWMNVLTKTMPTSTISR